MIISQIALLVFWETEPIVTSALDTDLVLPVDDPYENHSRQSTNPNEAET